MSLGTLGSTLNDELNRLANGGTYRDMDDMVDEALAAKQWANRENITPYSTDTVGVLNEIAGLGLDKKNWLDFNGICNYIAGTSGLPAAAALRQIYPTTDLLTGVASYYVDAVTPTNFATLGYASFNNTSGNYLSIPDANNLDITGDLDLRVKYAANSWTDTATLLSKWQTTSLKSYGIAIDSSGNLVMYLSNNGTTTITKTSTVAPSFTNGQAYWIRAVVDVDNGASGYDVKFYTSTNGSSWTQLGSTVTTAGVLSIYSSTSELAVGGLYLATTQLPNGNIYNAQVYSGIDGTKVFDLNVANDWKTSNYDTFTATTGQTVTALGFNTLANYGTAGSLLPTTLGSSTSADSNDPKFLDHTGTNYVYLPGVAVNNMSVPDAAALDITGDLDLRVQVALDDWTPASTQGLLTKRTTGQFSYSFTVISSGIFRFTYTTDGSTTVILDSTVATGVTDGATKWVRVTFDVDNGASGNDAKFYLSDDGTNWTQLGTTVTSAGTASIFSGTAPVVLGARFGTGLDDLVGKYFRAQILDGIDGTTVLDVDTSVITTGAATSFTAVTGQTVTINRSTSGRKTVAVTQPTWLFGTDDYMEVNNRWLEHTGSNYLYLPGVSGNWASTPDAAVLDITGDIDLRAKVALDDWTPAAVQTFVSKRTTAQIAFSFDVAITGELVLNWSTDGTAVNAVTSSVATGVADGATKWVRATLDVDNGNSENEVKFFLSDDGTNWTQLGTTITTAGTTSIFNSNTTLGVGARQQGNGITAARGKFFRAQVLDGIDGTVAFDANFETGITSLLQANFTESSLNAATVTINRTGSAFRSSGITEAGYLYPGATNTFTASATDFLNFGAADSFSIVAIVRQWATAGTNPYINKISQTSASGQGWYLNPADMRVGDGTTRLTRTYTGPTAGTLGTLVGIRNTATDNIFVYSNETVSAATTDTTTGTLANLFTTMLGRPSFSAIYQDFELVGAAVFRQALTAAQVRQITNYFANREVYL